MAPSSPPRYCDRCDKRIVRAKDNFDERYDGNNGFLYARHYDCEPLEAKVTMVKKHGPVRRIDNSPS